MEHHPKYPTHQLKTRPARERNVFQAIEDVQSLRTMGLKIGRENILKYLKKAGIDHNQLKVFHVTGTNGKGSVCNMIYQTLYKQFGYRVGLFTSPHVVNITERFQVNGVQIEDSRLNDRYLDILETSEEWEIALSFFEIQVITAVTYFLDQGVDYAVFEVGMGGKYDGTNIWDHPVATYITSIAFEHTNVLGTTRESILRNKVAIAKKNCPMFTPFDNKIIWDYCRKVDAKHISIKGKTKREKGKVKNCSPEKVGRKASVKSGGFESLTNLPGKHQQQNALLVLTSLVYLGFDKNKARKGLQDIHLLGRLQKVHPRVIVDTANNKESLRSLVQALGGDFFANPRLVFLFGTTQQEIEDIPNLAALIPVSRRYLVQGFHRATEVNEYKSGVDGVVGVFDDPGEALGALLQDELTVLLVTGSLYLVSDVIRYFKYKK